MNLLVLICFAVGISTMAGAGIGLLCRDVPDRVRKGLSGASAGIMLCSAIFGLMLPASENGGSVFEIAGGVVCGTLLLSGIYRLTPMFAGLFGLRYPENADSSAKNMILFILAMGLHHFPEGIAAGVSFGTGNLGDIITVAGGIALQNIPEAMVLIFPLCSIGVSKLKSFVISAVIALTEVVGVCLGYFAVTFSSAVLPFLLCLSAGTMLYVLLSDMIPDACGGKEGKLPTYFAVLAFCGMYIIGKIF